MIFWFVFGLVGTFYVAFKALVLIFKYIPICDIFKKVATIWCGLFITIVIFTISVIATAAKRYRQKLENFKKD